MTKSMTREEIESAVQGLIADAITYGDAELSPLRAQATKFYNGEKFGDEEAGRSQVVLTDVRDTVLAILPSLVRMFFPTSGHVVEYRARPKTIEEIASAVAMAEQATQYVNEVVLDQDNNGFLECYSAWKDGLVRKIGAMKYWWEDSSQYRDYTATGLDVNGFELLAQDPDIEITKITEYVKNDQVVQQIQQGIVLRDVEYRQWRRDGIAKIRCMPPEELLISRDARDRDDASFVAHRTDKTRSELIAMGVDPQEIDEYGGPSSDIRQNIEEITRRGGITVLDKAPDEAGEKNLWIEAYPYLDVDGDGIAELVRLRLLGPGHHLVADPEPVDERPFALFCPDPEPHVLIGHSVADRVMDLQHIKSSVLRSTLDSLALSLYPDDYYMEGIVDRQAMESTAISKRIPVRDGVMPANAVMEFKHEFVGAESLPVLQYLDLVKQQRVGPLPATLDPDALQSTPEIGVKATVQAASEQLELIARIFAATGMKQLFKGLLKLLVEHQPRARIVRLRGQYVPVDPRAWDAEMDVSVNVALGTQEKLGVLAATAQRQEAALQLLGPTNPLVTIGQLRHTYATMLELQGLPDTGQFWNPIPLNWQPPPTPPQPNAEMLLAQAEIQKAQVSLQKAQAEFQIEQVKAAQQMAELKASLASKAAELEQQREEMHLIDERERDRIEADISLRAAELQAKYGVQVNLEAERANLERERIAADVLIAQTKVRKARKANGDTNG